MIQLLCLMIILATLMFYRYAVVVTRSGQSEYYANINAASFRVMQQYIKYNYNHCLHSLVDHRALLVLQLQAVWLLLPAPLLQLVHLLHPLV